MFNRGIKRWEYILILFSLFNFFFPRCIAKKSDEKSIRYVGREIFSMNSTLRPVANESWAYGFMIQYKNPSNSLVSKYKERNQCYLISTDAFYKLPIWDAPQGNIIRSFLGRQRLNVSYGISGRHFLVYFGISFVYMETKGSLIMQKSKNIKYKNLMGLHYITKMQWKNRLTPFFLKIKKLNKDIENINSPAPYDQTKTPKLANTYFKSIQGLFGFYVYQNIFNDLVKLGVNIAFYSDCTISISPLLILTFQSKISKTMHKVNLKAYDDLIADEEEKKANSKLSNNMELAQNL